MVEGLPVVVSCFVVFSGIGSERCLIAPRCVCGKTQLDGLSGLQQYALCPGVRHTVGMREVSNPRHGVVGRTGCH